MTFLLFVAAIRRHFVSVTLTCLLLAFTADLLRISARLLGHLAWRRVP